MSVAIKLEGGCGNQLFMQSMIFAYAKKHGLDYCVYTKVNNPHIYDKQEYKIDAYRFPGINYCDNEPLLPIYNEPHYHYAEIPKIDNVCFKGFWQSFKYVGEYRNGVLKAFGFDNIETQEGFCSIHIRRTDYLLYPDHHPTVTIEYLAKAINHMVGDFTKIVKFKIFSDDIKWCKENITGIYGDSVFYSEGKSELEDLRDMASCEHNITANSTFSAWAAYINPNPNKIVIQPSRWFGEKLNHDTKDLYLPQAIII